MRIKDGRVLLHKIMKKDKLGVVVGGDGQCLCGYSLRKSAAAVLFGGKRTGERGGAEAEGSRTAKSE